MRARIAEKREVAKGTLLVLFDLLGATVDFAPGQYFWVTLLDPPYDDERGPRRHFSVVTSPTDQGVLGFCTRLRESAFKRSLVELPLGTEVEVEEPKGSFVLPAETDVPYVFIGGGIGITVFRSMLRYISHEGLGHRVTLVYSNRDRASTAFLDHLVDDLAAHRYLVAGPPPMVEGVTGALAAAGVPDDRVAADRFSGY